MQSCLLPVVTQMLLQVIIEPRHKKNPVLYHMQSNQRLHCSHEASMIPKLCMKELIPRHSGRSISSLFFCCCFLVGSIINENPTTSVIESWALKAYAVVIL